MALNFVSSTGYLTSTPNTSHQITNIAEGANGGVEMTITGSHSITTASYVGIRGLAHYVRIYRVLAVSGQVITIDSEYTAETTSAISQMAIADQVTSSHVANYSLSGHRYYDLGLSGLRVANNTFVLILPEEETLLIRHRALVDGTVDVQVGGLLQFGLIRILNGHGRTSVGDVIINNGDPSYTRLVYAIRVRGTLLWYGGKVTQRGTFLVDGGNMVVRDGVYSGEAEMRLISTQIDIDGLKVVGSGVYLYQNPTAFKNVLVENIPENPSPNWNSGGITMFGGYEHPHIVLSRSNDLKVVTSPTIRGASYDLLLADEINAKLKNAEFPSTRYDVRSISNNFGYDRESKGYLQKVQSVKFEIKDSERTDIEGAKCLIADTNNGSRVNQLNHDDLSDKSYVGTTDSNGEYLLDELITCIWSKNIPTADGTPEVIDYRSKFGNDGTDTFDYLIYDYQYQQIIGNFSAYDDRVIDIRAQLNNDPNISETDESVVGAYDAIDTYDKLYDACKLWKKNNMLLPTPYGVLVRVEDDVLIFGMSVNFKSGTNANPIQYNAFHNEIVVYVGNSNVIRTGSKLKRLRLDGMFIREVNVNVNGLYQYQTADGRIGTSHHLFPTTAQSVINGLNKQNIHIHASSRDYTKLVKDGVDVLVHAIIDNGRVIEFDVGGVETRIPFDSLVVGTRLSTDGSRGDKGVRVDSLTGSEATGGIGTIRTTSSFADAGFEVGSPIYISNDDDVTDVNLIELEDLVGQISYYFAYIQNDYYDIEVDIFGDVRRSRNTFDMLPDEVVPVIEPIAGFEQIGVWRNARDGGVSATVTENDITFVGDWSNKLPEQLVWNIQEAITEWNKAHPLQSEKLNDDDYYTISGRRVVFHKPITSLAGFTATSTTTFDRFVFADSDHRYLTMNLGIPSETTTFFSLIVQNVQVGDVVAILNENLDSYTTETLNNTTVLNGITTFLLNKHHTFKLRIRRKGKNELVINASTNTRTIVALFLGISNYEYGGSFTGNVADYLAWDSADSSIVLLRDNIESVGSFYDMITEFNHTFPQGVDAVPLINTDFGTLNEELTLNYQMKTRNSELRRSAAQIRVLMNGVFSRVAREISWGTFPTVFGGFGADDSQRLQNVNDSISNQDYGLGALRALLVTLGGDGEDGIPQAVKDALEGDDSVLKRLEGMTFGDIEFSMVGQDNRMTVRYRGEIVAQFSGVYSDDYDPKRWIGRQSVSE